MISTMFRGIGGELEVQRVLGAAGVASYIVFPHLFVAWELAHGKSFDLVAYCTAYPAGLAAALAASAGAIGWKDRQVAKAKAETPAAAPSENPA